MFGRIHKLVIPCINIMLQSYVASYPGSQKESLVHQGWIQDFKRGGPNKGEGLHYEANSFTLFMRSQTLDGKTNILVYRTGCSEASTG